MGVLSPLSGDMVVLTEDVAFFAAVGAAEFVHAARATAMVMTTSARVRNLTVLVLP